jgi:hypothetical protein
VSSLDIDRLAGGGAEWEAVIRGRTVTCRWVDGRFDGDWEVLARLEVLPDGGHADTLDQARRLISCVLLDPTERPLGSVAA